MKRIGLIAWGVFGALHAFAQLHFDASIANNHLWRGMEVADGVVLTGNVACTMLNGYLDMGIWGGSNASGDYKEFNYHLSFQTGGFSLAFWDTYNFSSGATYNNREFFNYRAAETGRFLDAIASYRLPKAFPLYLSWSTILFGRDRNTSNTVNKYSSFCYVEYPLYDRNGWKVEAGVGGAFALNQSGNRSHFYGDTPGIVHVSMRIAHSLSLGHYLLPVHACAVWNPQSNQAYLQIGTQLFSL